MARLSGGANNMHPLSWGGAQTEKIPIFVKEGYIVRVHYFKKRGQLRESPSPKRAVGQLN